MQYHVYAVWDFMCLAKSLQHAIVPSSGVWIPDQSTSQTGRLINEIITSEETDVHPSGGYISHFDLYVEAMREIGADTSQVLAFIEELRSTNTQSLNQLMLKHLPVPCRTFCTSTFDFIATQKPHVIAAAFAYGREKTIPKMFILLKDQLRVSGIQAPMFEYYLDRHIQLDGEEHGPAADNMVTQLCTNAEQLAEAEAAALKAITHRITLWDQVERVLTKVRTIRATGTYE